MVDKTIVKSVQKYLEYVKEQGIPVSYGVLFGSYVKNEEHTWSDIDVLVVSPRFDENQTTDDYERLWMYAARTNKRIEPIPVGEKQYKEDRTSLILDVARREGQIIPLAE
ncbi:MAG TPA: nucleotidyltransferase domain-containing protein [Anaerolineales bacterium]|nr:nucleotidyltransferase domain-containing protein [Anaerolineales bacterium]